MNGKIKPAAFLQQVFFMRWRMWNFTQKRRYGVKIHKKTSIYLSILLLDKGEEKVYNNITVERGGPRERVRNILLLLWKEKKKRESKRSPFREEDRDKLKETSESEKKF